MSVVIVGSMLIIQKIQKGKCYPSFEPFNSPINMRNRVDELHKSGAISDRRHKALLEQIDRRVQS